MKPGMMVCGAGLAWSVSVMAELPPALDRVPGEAVISVSVRQIAGAKGKIEKIMGMLPIPGDQNPLAELNQMLNLEGLDQNGSVALVMMGIPDDTKPETKDNVVIIVPVTDYAGFAKGLKAEGRGVQKAMMNDDAIYLKDIGGGYAAMGPLEAVVQAFKGDAGMSKGHSALIGAQGQSIGDSADALMVANLRALRPQMEKGIAQMKEGIAQAPAEAKAMMESMVGVAEGLARDGQAGVLGISISDLGIRFEGAAQFADKSEWASYFTGGKQSSELLGKLPNQAFLMAGAMDTSSPGMKRMIGQMMKLAEEGGKAMPGGQNPMNLIGINPGAMIETVDGQAFIIGNSPAGLMGGGLLLNSSSYVKTSDPQGLAKFMKDSCEKMNGTSVQGLKYTSSYESGVANVAGTSVDTWGMSMEAEPGNPEADQIAMMMPMIFGPDGMGGYLAPAKGGIVTTLSKNQPYLEQALKAAAGDGGGLTNEASIKSVAAELPADRSAEFYFGLQSILEQAGPMIGIPVGDEQVPPVALAGACGSGGMRFTLFLPSKVMQLIGQFGGVMGQGAVEEETGQPGF
jgi:hypothetical protein